MNITFERFYFENIVNELEEIEQLLNSIHDITFFKLSNEQREFHIHLFRNDDEFIETYIKNLKNTQKTVEELQKLIIQCNARMKTIIEEDDYIIED